MSEIVTFAESLIPLIRELRHTTENDRRIAEPIVQAIRKSDLCRILLDTGEPPRYGPGEWLQVLETLAGVEASVSWLVWNNTLPCFWARFLDDAARQNVPHLSWYRARSDGRDGRPGQPRRSSRHPRWRQHDAEAKSS